ncbi:ABC transporter ATP-binding protein [uncultured Maritimibacter sp.]|jgi:branched-chain amino acid transport system ATP-binding protein|uniref:ABC transporter ATP-binding protein n=1 Tax=uncultured Maritimibacter sp. TaxID=991866 RepID=UPI000AF3E1C0|nr:ABC transporter ATP-binding protein [uncultured Maritimibacter sp.]
MSYTRTQPAAATADAALAQAPAGRAATPDQPTALAARGLVKRYGSLLALDHVSFHAFEGEAVGVVGPNGAGKTTLFGALAGTFPVNAGTIRFGGTPITTLGARDRNLMGIARTYQVPRPFRDMTLFENVLVAARAGGGVPACESVDHAAEILERTGLLPLANTPAAAAGLLDLKRLEVARAMATRPSVILLDEIGGGLTEAELVTLIELIRGMRASGLTIVWIEHILHALLKVVTRLVCMAEGRVLAEGDPQEVMSDPAVRSAYFGSDPS